MTHISKGKIHGKRDGHFAPPNLGGTKWQRGKVTANRDMIRAHDAGKHW